MAAILLDTSVCIEILRGNPPPSTLKRRRFVISSIVEAELWAGVYHTGGHQERLKVERLLAAAERIPFDSSAAEATGKVLGSLAQSGRKIGDFDAQIAGHALATKSDLLTKNPKHFSRVQGLKIINWPGKHRR